MTRTYVALGISDQAYNEIERRMYDSGYDYQIENNGIALPGIALVRDGPPAPLLDRLRQLKPGEALIDYTNHRGERSWRRIEPSRIYVGSTTYHKQTQWLLVAHDLDKDALRTYAMRDIHEFISYVEGASTPEPSPT